MAQSTTEAGVHRADPGRRRLLLRLLVVLALAGIACLFLLQSWLSQDLGGISVQDAVMLRRSKWILLADLWLLSAIATGGAAYALLRLAAATRAERRWPPAGARTATDVKVKYLTAADQVARRLRVAACVAGAISATCAVAAGLLAVKLF